MATRKAVRKTARKATRKTARKAAPKRRAAAKKATRRKLSPEGRRAISEAATLRWEIYRAEQAREQRRLERAKRKRAAR